MEVKQRGSKMQAHVEKQGICKGCLTGGIPHAISAEGTRFNNHARKRKAGEAGSKCPSVDAELLDGPSHTLVVLTMAVDSQGLTEDSASSFPHCQNTP